MSDKSEINIEGIKSLPKGGENFLESLEEELDLEKVRCIQVFGSSVRGEVSEVSDLDLIIALKDKHSDYREEAKLKVSSLAKKHLETESESRNFFEEHIDSKTGMFKSGMVTTESAIRAGRQQDIGDVSRLSAFGPWRIILAKMFDDSATIYGERVEPEWGDIGRPEDLKFRELLKSLLITFALSSAQLFYSIFSSRSTLYSMEAYKWTVFNCGFLISEEIKGLQGSMDILPDFTDIKERFLELREDLETDHLFILRAPFEVTALHLWVFGQLLSE